MTKLTNILDDGSVIVLHIPYGGDFLAAMKEHQARVDHSKLILRVTGETLTAGTFHILNGEPGYIRRFVQLAPRYISYDPRPEDQRATHLEYLNISWIDCLEMIKQCSLGYVYPHNRPYDEKVRREIRKINRVEMLEAHANALARTFVGSGIQMGYPAGCGSPCACMGPRDGDPLCFCAMKPYRAAAQIAVLKMLNEKQ